MTSRTHSYSFTLVEEVATTSTRLDEIETRLRAVLDQAATAGMAALAAGNEAGELIHEAEAICKRDGHNFKDWLEQRVRLNRERARTLVQLHIDWPEIQQRINPQMAFDFGAVRRLVKRDGCEDGRFDNAMFDAIDPPDSAYTVPESLSVDFQYPDEEEPEESHTASEAISQLYQYIIPRELRSREDWRTCLVRFVGMAFLLGAMPEGVSMRDACRALNVSHATISKYVRRMADATGIRSPIQKREATRAKYSKAQTANHWRRKP